MSDIVCFRKISAVNVLEIYLNAFNPGFMLLLAQLSGNSKVGGVNGDSNDSRGGDDFLGVFENDSQ